MPDEPPATGSQPPPRQRRPQLTERPTLRTLAERTGFSVTAVSRALKDGPELSLETRTLVKKAADELGYRPNRAGVRLRTGRSYVICFIMNQEDAINQFGRKMLIGASATMRPTSYHLVVMPQFVDQAPLDLVRYVVETNAADGLIITHTTPQDERVKYLLERGFPFIAHGRTELATPHAYYDYDNFAFAYQATLRLIGRGRRRIALVRPPLKFTYSHFQLGGYMRAVQEHGLEPIIPDTVTLDTPPLRMRAFALESGRGEDAPDGYVCGSEDRCLGLVTGLQAAGLRIGRDVDVVAKQTSDLLDYVAPPLDALTEDLGLAGAELVRLLMRSIDGDPVDELQMLEQPAWRIRAAEARR